MKAKDLKFNKVEEGPGFTCNVCSHKYTNSHWRIADIPIHNGKNTASIVVCSKACLKHFLAHPDANQFVTDLIKRTEAMTPPEPTAEEISNFEDILKASVGSIFGGELKIIVNKS